jgi:hypothetical protein
MARGDRGTAARRRLWRRHRQNREAVELYDQQGREKQLDLPEAVWSAGAKTAASMGIMVTGESRIWKLPRMLLADVVVKTTYRIKVVSDGSWWQLSRIDLRSSAHFNHCLAERLEEDG